MSTTFFRLTTVLLCAAVLTWASAAGADEGSIMSRKVKLEKAKEYFSIGQLFIKEGNYAAANEEFAKSELMLQEAAITPLEETIADFPEKDVKAEEEKKRVEKALEYYLKEIRKETSNPDYYFNLGVDYLNKGQFVQAEESFKLAVSLDPLDKDACYNLGVLYEKYLGNSEKALKYYQQYLNIAPDAPDYLQIREWVKAIKAAKGER